jgi:hypothetical protein
MKQGQRALEELAEELSTAETLAVEKMMASEEQVARADANNAKLARELWSVRQTAEEVEAELRKELESLRRCAADASATHTRSNTRR